MFFKRLDYKYYFVIVLSYALLLFLAIGCIFTQSDRIYKQLEFYKSNGYQYAYKVSGSVKENDYLYGESIYFYADKNRTQSLLGDCVMSLDESIYDEDNPFQVSGRLEMDEIALSYNLAKQHGLSVGSKVYSKHNVRSKIEEYTVAEILPVCYGITRVDYGINRGVMLIGYDSDYKENTDYPYIAFSEDDPSSLIQNSGVNLIDLDAKESHREDLFEKIVVWQSLIGVCTVGLTILYAIIHWKNQKNYYSRLYRLGGAPKAIKKQVLLDMILPGTVGQFLATVLCIAFASFNNMYFSYKTVLISICTAFIVLMCTSIVIHLEGRKV